MSESKGCVKASPEVHMYSMYKIHNSTKDKIWTPMGQKKVSFVSEVSSFQRLKCMQEWYLGWACLEKCPQFMGVLIERERFYCI